MGGFLEEALQGDSAGTIDGPLQDWRSASISHLWCNPKLVCWPRLCMTEMWRSPSDYQPIAPPLMMAASKWKHQLWQVYSSAGSVGKTSCLKQLAISFRQSKAIEVWEAGGSMKWLFECSFFFKKSLSDAWLSRTGLLLFSGTLIINWIPSKAWKCVRLQVEGGKQVKWWKAGNEAEWWQQGPNENNQHQRLLKELGHREGRGQHVISKHLSAFAGECLCHQWQNQLM